MGTNTTNISLYKPSIGETGWGALVNANADSLDALAGAGVVLRTSTTKFPNATVLSALSNGILRNNTGTGVITIANAGVDYYAPGLGQIPISDGGTGVSTVPSNGQLLIGNGTGYTVASLTPGAGISITPGAGSIAIAATGSSAAGGLDTQVQVNSSGSLAGYAGLTYVAGVLSTPSLSLTTDLPISDGGTGASTAAGARTNLGLGSMALQDSGAVAITGGSISGITQLAVLDGGTGAGNAAGARTNLGLGTMAVQDAAAVAVTGGSITGITPLLPVDGGLGTPNIPTDGQIPIGNAGSYIPAHINAGTGITIVNAGASVTISAPAVGEINTASNVGTGEGSLFKQKVGVDLQFKTLKQGSNITLTNNADDVTIASTDTGEANTASNVGTGTGLIYRSKTGVNLDLKSLVQGTGIVLTNNANDITIASPGEANTASNVGTGEGSVFKQKTGVDLELKTLKQGANITITNNADDVTIAAAAGGSQHIIQDEGVPLTARSRLNFVGTGVTVTDGGAGPDSTIVTVLTTPGSAHVIQDNGVPLTQRSFLNFVGATVTDGGAGPDSTIVTVQATGRSYVYALMGA